MEGVRRNLDCASQSFAPARLHGLKRQRLLRGIGNRFFRPARRAFPGAASNHGGDPSLEAITAEQEAAVGARPEGIDPR